MVKSRCYTLSWIGVPQTVNVHGEQSQAQEERAKEKIMTTFKNKRRYWGVIGPVMPANMLAQVAKQQEDMGLEGTLAAQVYGPPWSCLAAAATATSRLQLASAVALAFTRSPFETAIAAMDLDRMSGGRASSSAWAPPPARGARVFTVCPMASPWSTCERRSR